MNMFRKFIKLDGFKKIYDYEYGKELNDKNCGYIPSGLYTLALNLVKDNELKHEEFMQSIITNHQQSMKELNDIIKPVQSDPVTRKMLIDLEERLMKTIDEKFTELKNLIKNLK